MAHPFPPSLQDALGDAVLSYNPDEEIVVVFGRKWVILFPYAPAFFDYHTRQDLEAAGLKGLDWRILNAKRVDATDGGRFLPARGGSFVPAAKRLYGSTGFSSYEGAKAFLESAMRIEGAVTADLSDEYASGRGVPVYGHTRMHSTTDPEAVLRVRVPGAPDRGDIVVGVPLRELQAFHAALGMKLILVAHPDDTPVVYGTFSANGQSVYCALTTMKSRIEHRGFDLADISTRSPKGVLREVSKDWYSVRRAIVDKGGPDLTDLKSLLDVSSVLKAHTVLSWHGFDEEHIQHLILDAVREAARNQGGALDSNARQALRSGTPQFRHNVIKEVELCEFLVGDRIVHSDAIDQLREERH
jgi:hypothetical protein